MNRIILTAAALTLFAGPFAFAGEGHAHGDRPASHSHKKEKCEKCKKGEKKCDCEDKGNHQGHDHKEEKKEAK